MSHHEQEHYTHPVTTENELSPLGRVFNSVGNFLKDNKNKLTASAVAGVLTITLAGCGVNAQEGGPKPDDKATSAPSPEATSTPEETEPAVPALVAELETYNYDTFNDADANHIRAYSLYRINENQDRHATMLEGKERPIWTTPSIDMDGQQILDNWQYVLDEARMATKFDAQNEDHYLDQDEARKILGAAYYEVHDGLTTQSYVNVHDDILAHTDGWVVTDESNTANSTSELTEGTDYAGNAITYKDVEYTNQNGDVQTARFVYSEFEGADGEPQSAWLLFELNS